MSFGVGVRRAENPDTHVRLHRRYPVEAGASMLRLAGELDEFLPGPESRRLRTPRSGWGEHDISPDAGATAGTGRLGRRGIGDFVFGVPV
ncbi:hypothetical protein [Actinoplanes sp. NPDC049265]|uniref:hypothetical protein n=1 Tax=Actinoplanes sp. NPDC049265 TaxID=3363902 RepID=UPI0037148E56